MNYKVIDPKGVAYMDNRGRQVIRCGAMLEEKLIDSGCFTKEGVSALIRCGRLAILMRDEPTDATFESPSNKKADISKKKGGKKK